MKWRDTCLSHSGQHCSADLKISSAACGESPKVMTTPPSRPNIPTHLPQSGRWSSDIHTNRNPPESHAAKQNKYIRFFCVKSDMRDLKTWGQAKSSSIFFLLRSSNAEKKTPSLHLLKCSVCLYHRPKIFYYSLLWFCDLNVKKFWNNFSIPLPSFKNRTFYQTDSADNAQIDRYSFTVLVRNKSFITFFVKLKADVW